MRFICFFLFLFILQGTLLKRDFNFRGNYKDAPDARNFGVTGSFGFNF